MKILIASKIDPFTKEKLGLIHDVVDGVNASHESLKMLIRGCEVIIFRSGVNISAELMRESPQLKLLIRAGSGLDNLDIDYVRQNNLSFVRIPEPGARAVAELAFGLMLTVSRQI